MKEIGYSSYWYLHSIMYLVLVVGLLFLTDWLVPSLHILHSLPFAYTQISSRTTSWNPKFTFSK
jgi:hypothetical protein